MIVLSVPKVRNDRSDVLVLGVPRYDAKPGTASAKKAPPSDRIKGSSKNAKGTAGGSRGDVELSETIVKSLSDKAKSHNESYKHKTDTGALKAVYRRGAGAYSSSHDPKMSRGQWAMARVNAFLKLLRSGKPDNPKYTTDFDLLPESHPKSTKRSDSKVLVLAVPRNDRGMPKPRKPKTKAAICTVGTSCGTTCISKSKTCRVKLSDLSRSGKASSDRIKAYLGELGRKAGLKPKRSPQPSKVQPIVKPPKLRVIDARSGFGTAQQPGNTKIPRFRVVDESGNVINAFNRKKEAEIFALKRQNAEAKKQFDD